jgi:PAS domain S-box-containing protein
MPKLLEQWQKASVLEAVFDQLSDAVLLYDRDMQLTGVNRAAEKLFGMTAEEMVGNHCSEVFRCAACEGDCGILVGIQQGPSMSNGVIRLTTAGGRERLAVIRTTQIHDDGGLLAGAVATIKDITAESAPQKREVIAESSTMREMLAFCRKIAASEATTIMIEGENGTGKDLIAKTIHFNSMRKAEAFIAINCAAIPETLLESELFGYEKGAFTDARAQKRGIFELADKGTLFLDEIGELPHMLQAKLLRVLEEQSFRRLGGLKDIQLDLRVIAATNRNLKTAVAEGQFRQDLYFRLNVIHIVIPPLRDRKDDILPLAKFFLDHYNQKFKRRIEGISQEAQRLILMHDWPGNVREVRNAIERAMILEETPLIRAISLPVSLTRPSDAYVMHAPDFVHSGAAPQLDGHDGAQTHPHPVFPAQIPDGGMSLEENERLLVISALEKTSGNQTQAARLLSITRDTLRYKMKKYNLK